MKKYECLNIDCILKAINARLVEDGFMLIKPVLANGACCDPGTFWLVDTAGDVVFDDFDLAEFSEGFNLLKSGELFGFEDFIANTCDGLLLKLGYGLEIGG